MGFVSGETTLPRPAAGSSPWCRWPTPTTAFRGPTTSQARGVRRLGGSGRGDAGRGAFFFGVPGISVFFLGDQLTSRAPGQPGLVWGVEPSLTSQAPVCCYFPFLFSSLFLSNSLWEGHVGKQKNASLDFVWRIHSGSEPKHVAGFLSSFPKPGPRETPALFVLDCFTPVRLPRNQRQTMGMDMPVSQNGVRTYHSEKRPYNNLNMFKPARGVVFLEHQHRNDNFGEKERKKVHHI